MGQGDDLAMLDSSLRWTEDQSPKRDAAVEGIKNNNMNPRDSGSVISQGPGGADDIRSFLDNETLCSRSGSLSHRLHPRPLHHYPNQPNHMKSRTHADSSHAHAPDSEDLHSLERPKPPLQPQRQRCTPAKIDASDCVDQNQDLGEHSFLFSRPTSIATMAMTTTTMDDYAEHYPSFGSSLHRPWRDEEQIELRIPSDTRPDDSESLRHNLQQYHDLLSEIDTECLFPDDSLFTADRPSSSRSHLLQWRRNQSPNSDSSKHLRVSSDAQPPTPESRLSTTITREEFEALPPTIQRKYFSTIERSQLAHSPDLSNRQRAGSVGHDQSLSPWSSLSTSRGSYEHQERPVTSDASIIHSDRPPRITSTDQRFYANLPEKIKRRHLTEEELLIAYDLENIATETTKEVSDKSNKHQPQDVKMQSPLSSPGLSEGQSSFSSMLPRQNNRGGPSSDMKRSESFYDSFRWLEDEEGLDLRLYLDDYHINLREEVPVPNNKSRRPSFRRHLSINKLPFGRPSVSYSRPGPGDDALPSSGIPSSASHSSSIGSSGHVRRKSRARALSLISANRQAPISPSPLTPPIDPAATHYQDPEARKKLRAYLASPQKFDEAIEFGFPSKDGSILRPAAYARTAELNKSSGHETDKLRSFLEDDRSSKYSDDASAAEPDSPRTPQLFDKTPHIRSLRNSIEHPSYSRGEKSLQDPATSREMTLRMTLTRPDLRQSEDQIYGWKQSSGSRGGSSREEPAPNPVIYAREGNPKQSIEKQLAALDQWEDQPDQDNGPVKRLWNRVKRS